MTLNRAKKKLGIETKREGFGAGASWTLPSVVSLHSVHPPILDMNGGEGSRKPLQDKGSSIHINPPSKLDMNDPPLNCGRSSLDMNEETCSERGGDPALPSPPERGDADYASEEWIYDFTAPGEPTRTHVSPPPPERAAGDDVGDASPVVAPTGGEPDTISFDDLPTPW